ncbi:MAG: hypothetical protein QOI09_2387, partial [Chloroflexota bacterium]|nr:hypothetical protein [Chloroflexota bacterium]
MHFPYAPSARPDGAFFVPDPASGHGRIGSVNRLPLVVAISIPLLAVAIYLAGLVLVPPGASTTPSGLEVAAGGSPTV